MSQNFIALKIVLAGTSMSVRDCAYSDMVTPLTYVLTLAGQSQSVLNFWRGFFQNVPPILEETPPKIQDGFHEQNLFSCFFRDENYEIRD